MPKNLPQSAIGKVMQVPYQKYGIPCVNAETFMKKFPNPRDYGFKKWGEKNRLWIVWDGESYTALEPVNGSGSWYRGENQVVEFPEPGDGFGYSAKDILYTLADDDQLYIAYVFGGMVVPPEEAEKILNKIRCSRRRKR